MRGELPAKCFGVRAVDEEPEDGVSVRRKAFPDHGYQSHWARTDLQLYSGHTYLSPTHVSVVPCGYYQ